MKLAVITDGGSHNNGGASAIGIVIKDSETKETLVSVGEAIGNATNTRAERQAFLRGMQEVIQFIKDCGNGKVIECEEVIFLSDSNLVIQQAKGEWKCKNAAFKQEFANLRKTLEQLVGKITIDHIPREYTHEADALASQAIDEVVRTETTEKYPFLSMT